MRSVLGALLVSLPAAFVVACVWGVYEALTLEKFWVSAWASATMGALVPAGLAVLLAWPGTALIAWAVSWWRRRWPRDDGAITWAGAAMAVVLVAAVGIGIYARLEHAERAVRVLGVVMPAGAAVLLGFAVATLVRGPWRRWSWRLPVRVRVYGPMVVFAMGVGGSLALVWRPVSLTLYFLDLAWLAESILVISLTWTLGLWARRSRWWCWSLLPFSIPTVVLAFMFLNRPVPHQAFAQLEQKRQLSSHYLPMFVRARRAQLPVVEGRTCVPGTQPLQSVGRVGANAPDIIFVSIDGVAWKHTTWGGAKAGYHTPVLDSFVDRGALFTRAYTPAPWTRQAFRSLFTGLHNGLIEDVPSTRWGLSFAENQHTVTTYLRDAGYRTITLLSDPKAFPKQHGALMGFDVVDEQSTGFLNQHGYESTYKVNQIIAHLLDLPVAGQPRFLWTHILDTHYAYKPGPGVKIRGVPEQSRHALSIKYVDEQLGRLLQFALDPARASRTWVFLVADHGESFMEHGNHRHGWTVYEEEIRVPLMVFGPGVVPGKYDVPVSTLEIMPTMLDIAGLQVPQNLCASSLRPQLVGKVPLPAKPVLSATLPDRTTNAFKLALVRGDEKLIVSPDTGALEFYDLRKDPGEKRNLADSDRKRTQAAVKTLKRLLQEQGRDPNMLNIQPTP